jgi:ABC-type nitrate/sulfonate/bicarbonate transport system substrate-binding protein
MGALSALLFCASIQPAARAETLRVIYFPGGTALPLYVAAKQGFFAAQGLTVDLIPTKTSQELMIGMLKSDYQIGQAAIDNVVAYQERQAAPDLDVRRDLFAFMGTSSTNLDLIVQRPIKSYADLKGGALAVDAPTTGFAFVLRYMLERGGLQPQDYRFIAIGGDPARLQALESGTVAGSLLTTGFGNQAVATGLRRLDTSLHVLKHYQGTCSFASRSWAESHRDELIRFIRAVVAADDWLFAPSHAEGAAQILSENSDGMSPAIAATTLHQLVSGKSRLARRSELDPQGIRVVLKLRSAYGEPRKTLTDPGKYIDLSYYQAALAKR